MTQTRHKVKEKLVATHVAYNAELDGGKKLWKKKWIQKKDMRKIMIPMKPIFPSDKITYDMKGVKLGGMLKNAIFLFGHNRTFDIEIFLEDSKRYFPLLLHLKMMNLIAAS